MADYSYIEVEIDTREHDFVSYIKIKALLITPPPPSSATVYLCLRLSAESIDWTRNEEHKQIKEQDLARLNWSTLPWSSRVTGIHPQMSHLVCVFSFLMRAAHLCSKKEN
jgi:hypothetical protein